MECAACKAVTLHKLIKDKRIGRKSSYYSCIPCAYKANVRYRKKHWYKYLAQKANARKVSGSIKLNEQMIVNLAEIQKYKCALTGVVFDIESKWYKPSLDRIDSDKGYTLDNLRLVVWIVNHCRGDLTDQDFIDMCKKVARKNK
jgi:hypothetical protein